MADHTYENEKQYYCCKPVFITTKRGFHTGLITLPSMVQPSAMMKHRHVDGRNWVGIWGLFGNFSAKVRANGYTVNQALSYPHRSKLLQYFQD